VFDGAAITRTPASDVPLPAATPASNDVRVLVIDDDTASRYVLARWLSDRYRVEQADSGASGIEQAIASQPDAIFLDVVMPDLTGFEVLERLKSNEQTRHIPVVVYTALTLGTNDRARLSSAVAILRKSTSSRVADRAAVESALVSAGIAISMEHHDV
jgi:CheY-like chemotaxis protein